jgi:hypothetical protein
MSDNQFQPRVASVAYQSVFGSSVVFAVVTMQNGFIVTGQAPCVRLEHFDQRAAMDAALQDAMSKVYMLESYFLAEVAMQEAQRQQLEAQRVEENRAEEVTLEEARSRQADSSHLQAPPQ